MASPTTRHDGWTPERKAAFLNELAECGTVRTAAARVGMSHASAYMLRRRDPDFGAAWEGALLLARDHAEDVLRERAIDGIEEPIWHKGEQVGTRIKHDNRLLLAHLARLDKAAGTPVARRAAARFSDMVDRIAKGKPTGHFLRQPLPAEMREGEGADAWCLLHDGEYDAHFYGDPAPDMQAYLQAQGIRWAA